MKTRYRISKIGTMTLITGLILLAAQAAATDPAVLYVKPGGITNGACDGWANACALPYALSIAGTDDELWLMQGIYTPTTRTIADDPRSATFQPPSGVLVYGGFAGDETALAQRDWLAHVTVLSGDLEGNDAVDEHGVVTDTAASTGTNAYHGVSSTAQNAGFTLDGVILTAGAAAGDALQDKYGGGLYNREGIITLRHVTFSGNHAEWYGGGFYNDNSQVVLSDGLFQYNTANNGGGLYAADSDLILTDVAFAHNVAGGGGGLYIYITTAHLETVQFTENQASLGGGMYTNYSPPTLVDVAFSGNVAESGGGMYNDDSSPTLTNVAFRGNLAHATGGGMDNRAQSAPTLHNALFSGNLAKKGGAVYNDAGSPTLINATLSGNVAEAGSGLYNRNTSAPVLVNCILWGNGRQTPDTLLLGELPLYNETSHPLIRHSDVEAPGGTLVGGGNLNVAPLFVAPIAAGSAPTVTGDYRLQRASPVIDAGSNLSVTASSDLAGNMRRVDIPEIPDTGEGDAPLVDMGAYEVPLKVYLPLVMRAAP